MCMEVGDKKLKSVEVVKYLGIKSAGAKHTQKPERIQSHHVTTLMYGSEMWLLNKQQE